MSLVVRQSIPEDCVALAPFMREADRQECLAASGLAPLAALRVGYERSTDPQTIVTEDGQPIAMFGVVPLEPGMGAPWMLGSGRIEEHWFEFTRRSRDEFHRVRSGWGRLTNWIDLRNNLHVRWVAWLGAHWCERCETYGTGRLPFQRFEWC